MPTYDYRCNECKHKFELVQMMKDGPIRKCPKCGKYALERLIGAGAAVIFKGSGFYETDYRSAAYKKSADADKPGTESGKETKADSTGSDSSKGEGSKTETKAEKAEPAQSEKAKSEKAKSEKPKSELPKNEGKGESSAAKPKPASAKAEGDSKPKAPSKPAQK